MTSPESSIPWPTEIQDPACYLEKSPDFLNLHMLIFIWKTRVLNGTPSMIDCISLNSMLHGFWVLQPTHMFEVPYYTELLEEITFLKDIALKMADIE